MLKNSFFLLILFLFACNTNNLSPYEKEIRQYRKDYLKGFLEDERSPLTKQDFNYVNFFQADSTFKVEANFQLLPDSEPFDIPTSSGKTKKYRQYASLSFELKDEPYVLYVYESMKYRDSEEYKDYLFLPFTDQTNGDQSYGGGRYIDLDKNDLIDGTIYIDFNKCYNPWCAYSDGYNCPVPPQENDLDLAVFAGEMKFSGVHKYQNKSD